ncbi:MAG: protein phosphatase CheZ [Kordiimonadaceae bacterium]|nr:protein phosphatase CheZ [Kordiimonadaceae bacterium]MBO6570685.1 protein phosphatase CheZ [Kordiimonadaceae bacterium]MBO6966457.1 protein phosphatase CheZ [Kordiimonadaceae bacterium]
MAKQAVAVTIEERTEALRKERGDNVSVDDIGSVVLSLVEGTAPDNEVDKIASELRDLLDFIGAAKAELVGMQPKSLSRRDIPDAGEQLDAIVEATEDAASTIMDAADSMMEIAAEVEAPQAEKLEAVSTELFQASSFQDLTGQRITKVTKTLGHLEERLSALAEAIGDDFVAPANDEIETDDEGVAVNDTDLLHGPQLEGEGNSQDEIDAILAAFD